MKRINESKDWLCRVASLIHTHTKDGGYEYSATPPPIHDNNTEIIAVMLTEAGTRGCRHASSYTYDVYGGIYDNSEESKNHHTSSNMNETLIRTTSTMVT